MINNNIIIITGETVWETSIFIILCRIVSKNTESAPLSEVLPISSWSNETNTLQSDDSVKEEISLFASTKP